MSLFISFEGGDGSGKSTQAKALHERLEQMGVESLLVREPGTTELGNHLRAWLIRERRETISPTAEAFLFAAARSELVSRVIVPALKNPHIAVIVDRYVDSTTAYQGYGRGISLSQLEVVNNLATQGLMPDLTILLDCPEEFGLKRTGYLNRQHESPKPTDANRIDQEGDQRFEKEPLEFHENVRRGYLKTAEEQPDRWLVIDATQSVEDINNLIWRHVKKLLSNI